MRRSTTEVSAAKPRRQTHLRHRASRHRRHVARTPHPALTPSPRTPIPQQKFLVKSSSAALLQAHPPAVPPLAAATPSAVNPILHLTTHQHSPQLHAHAKCCNPARPRLPRGPPAATNPQSRHPHRRPTTPRSLHARSLYRATRSPTCVRRRPTPSSYRPRTTANRTNRRLATQRCQQQEPSVAKPRRQPYSCGPAFDANRPYSTQQLPTTPPARLPGLRYNPLIRCGA